MRSRKAEQATAPLGYYEERCHHHPGADCPQAYATTPLSATQLSRLDGKKSAGTLEAVVETLPKLRRRRVMAGRKMRVVGKRVVVGRREVVVGKGSVASLHSATTTPC